MASTSKFSVRTVFMLLLGAGSACAGEYAVLSSGFRIHATSHEFSGDKVHLQTDKGAIELPVGLVTGFEPEEYTPPPPTPESAPISSPLLAVEAPAVSPREMVSAAAKQAGLPPALVHSLVKAESAYQTKALSPKGAIGLMQLMPGTAAALHADPYDPKQNVKAGVAYLRELLVRYQYDPHQVTKAIAAYNAGPGAVDKYQGIPPYRETIQYVTRVVQQYLKNQNAQ